MGTFLGHAFPGTFFALFSLWWATQVPRRRLLCEQKKITYFNTATFPVPFSKLSKYPIEGIAKMIASILGMACELFASLGYGTLKLEYGGDIQHFTMYSCFLFSGVVDCFVYRGSKVLPRGMDYFALAFAFCAEGMLFYHHLYGRSAIDVLVHMLLLYIIVACAIITMVEYRYQSSEIITVLRAYFTLFQGTWFFQVGFILYPPLPSLKHWDEDDGDQLMVVTMIFGWHFIGNLVVIMMIYLIVRSCYTRHCRLFDFHIEHQLVSWGWTVQRLRQRHQGHRYQQVQGQEDEHTLLQGMVLVSDEEETEIA